MLVCFSHLNCSLGFEGVEVGIIQPIQEIQVVSLGSWQRCILLLIILYGRRGEYNQETDKKSTKGLVQYKYYRYRYVDNFRVAEAGAALFG